MSPEIKLAIVQLLLASPDQIGDLPGEVFSTGSKALAPSDLYVVGLNPGFGCSYRTIRSHVEDWSLDHYSAFLDQCWKEQCWNKDSYGMQTMSGCGCVKGVDKHQQAVQRLIQRARPGIDRRRVFATNAVFAKSDSEDSCRQETGLTLSRAFDSCWPIHQLFLTIIQPRVILSLGYAEGASAFSLFGRKAAQIGEVRSHSVHGRKFPSFKWANMTFNLGAANITCLVVGVRHPSYVPDAANTQEFSDLLAGTRERLVVS